jgi:methyl-accepting chemotaxis protein
MTIATKTLAGQRILTRTYSLPAVIALTEQCFVSAGDNLAMAVDSLNRTKAIFTRLETTLGDDTGRQLSQLISTVMANLTGIRADLDGLLNLGDASRMAVRRVRAEVSELDRIVRSIACVSVNARILGNVLSPPRP